MTRDEKLTMICSVLRKELDRGRTVKLHYRYSDTLVITYNGKRVCSRGGANYDRLGAAFGDIVNYIDREALNRVAILDKPLGLYLDSNNVLRIDGAVGMSCVVDIMARMGYYVDYGLNSRRYDNGTCSGDILIKRR